MQTLCEYVKLVEKNIQGILHSPQLGGQINGIANLRE